MGKEQELGQLIEQLRSRDRTVVWQAVDVLRERGWLTDGSLTKANLRRARLRAANLLDANLGGVDLRGASLFTANLRGAYLAEANLTKANLAGANLSGAYLHTAKLIEANLEEAVLIEANLREANLSGAKILKANLGGANLTKANLARAVLWAAELIRAELTEADLSEANLNNTVLGYAVLRKTVLTATKVRGARCGYTVFADLDLSKVQELETIYHYAPSTIGIDTIYKSQGKIPQAFLRGCGLPDNIITYLPSLVDQSIEFYSCFISYSHADKEFARLLHDRLQGEGIRCWLDEHLLNPGDPLHPTIYEAIRVYDKIILCCSETALKSWWVEKEFTRTMRKEEDFKLPLLIPLDLDGYLFEKECTSWIADEIKQRSVQHMTEWKDHDQFEVAVKRVINALRTDGGKLPPPEPKLEPKR